MWSKDMDQSVHISLFCLLTWSKAQKSVTQHSMETYPPTHKRLSKRLSFYSAFFFGCFFLTPNIVGSERLSRQQIHFSFSCLLACRCCLPMLFHLGTFPEQGHLPYCMSSKKSELRKVTVNTPRQPRLCRKTWQIAHTLAPLLVRQSSDAVHSIHLALNETHTLFQAHCM